MLQLSGLVSGIDTQSLVNTIVQAERAPRQSSIQRQQQQDTVELSALGQLQSAINGFHSAIEKLGESEAFNGRRATFSNSEALDVALTNNAVTGSYSFTVQQLATNQQQATAGFAEGATFGAGNLVLTVNGESLTLTLDSANNTLADIRDAINSADNNPGASATIINNGNQQRLLINSTRTGADYGVVIDASDLTAGAGDLNLTTGLSELQEAANARIVIGDPANPNSIVIEHSDNSIEGVVDGVTLNLKEISTTPVSVDISLDKSSSEDAIQGFVSAYNELTRTVNSLTRFTEGQGSSALTGDATVRSLVSSVRNILSDSIEVNGQSLRLADFGIKTATDGTLETDSAKLSEAVQQNFSALQGFFASDNGLSGKMTTLLDRYDSSTGIVKERMDRLDENIKGLDRELEDLDLRIEQVRRYWESRFLSMERALSQFNSTSSFLTNNLNSLNSNDR
ncbi:flagellar filament capping protein FliD [Parendozoicomonas sp. Alg238-R29]|uniref:flagellar filament capping protein FliD n=1 Tax=Parendozoicomonas sp. Alg238-R29 TaxID=2993446 RepID=UPI00248DD7D5|nr:flagellar filament capping protein FliD [Parendozoicomonas sp. Alg238-R29]